MKFFEGIDISTKDFSTVLSAPHRHNYFELLYILNGEGVHIVNESKFNYAPGALFLLTPEDVHTFRPISETKSCIIDFTSTLFTRRRGSDAERAELSEFFPRLEYVFQQYRLARGNLLEGRKESLLLESLIKQLITEKESASVYTDIIVQSVVFLLLQLLARIIDEKSTTPTGLPLKNRVHEILGYIHEHIYSKELLKIDGIARCFHQTSDNINRYFKKETGTTIKHYISQYKIKLAESRLIYTDLSVAEIADELQFTDESHLNKIFKKYRGQTAKAFQSSHRG
ncbi:MAG: helix-turn-helix domain-containing protein [Mucilaginibacter sp.]|nr:helix-turn-helix domain-containing protein [Mucilaginibacter sp.]